MDTLQHVPTVLKRAKFNTIQEAIRFYERIPTENGPVLDYHQNSRKEYKPIVFWLNH